MFELTGPMEEPTAAPADLHARLVDVLHDTLLKVVPDDEDLREAIHCRFASDLPANEALLGPSWNGTRSPVEKTTGEGEPTREQWRDLAISRDRRVQELERQAEQRRPPSQSTGHELVNADHPVGDRAALDEFVRQARARNWDVVARSERDLALLQRDEANDLLADARAKTGDGTPHARMEGMWGALDERSDLLTRWSDYSPIMSDMRGVIEYQAIIAIDRMAAEIERLSSRSTGDGNGQCKHQPCRAPHCWNEYGTPCGPAPTVEPTDDENKYGSNFNDAIAKIRKLPSSERSAISNRPASGVVQHGMIPGSHERLHGPECRCGMPWDSWNDVCTGAE